VPEAPDLDFLAAGDVGHDDRKWSRLGLFTEAHGEILPKSTGQNLTPGATTFSWLMKSRIASIFSGFVVVTGPWPASPGFMPADNTAVRTVAPAG